MRLPEFFDHAYVVNLPERVDRRRQTEQELHRAGLGDGVEFFPAIRPAEVGDWPSLGAHGCFLSHLGVLKRAQADGADRVLVFEDDIDIDPRLQDHEAALVEQLRDLDWGFVYFGHPLEVDGPTPSLQRLEQRMTTAHFYGVNGPVLGRLIDYLETVKERPRGHPDGGRMHVDGAYNRFREANPDVAAYLAVPNFGEQRASRSDISVSWFDQVPGLREAAQLARRGRRLLSSRGRRADTQPTG